MMMTIIIIAAPGFVKWDVGMRISKAQAQENRERVVATASALFRANGFDGVAVGDLMKAAGFTHGGFYNHFGSKEALAAEALGGAWEEMGRERARARDLPQLLKRYLSWPARQAPAKGCPAAALAGDVGRQSRAVKAVFADGLEGMIQSIEEGLPKGGDGPARERAVNLVARMVGALMLSRAVPDDHPLALELLNATLRGALREATD
jgi:TetR/AcrR family transcriptional repressor of nem operon